jgi:hypothetical protein
MIARQSVRRMVHRLSPRVLARVPTGCGAGPRAIRAKAKPRGPASPFRLSPCRPQQLELENRSGAIFSALCHGYPFGTQVFQTASVVQSFASLEPELGRRPARQN